MDELDDSASDVSETVLAPFNEDIQPFPNEVVEDLTVESASASDDLSDAVSLASLTLTDGPPVIKPRPYQLEMVEASLKENIIVAMDTGSGKTHVAIMRIKYELERMLPDQLIWFLAPTVSLCSQQYEYIESQISVVQVKFLSGADGVDRWTEQSLWDGVLRNVKIVVSTYQILMDALTHAFVKMNSLKLIIFDEAHNCVGKQSGAKLMQNFYHQRKAKGLAVPHVLGLTASPVMRSDPHSVAKIEETLDAICRTPTKHREELRLQVNLPVFSQVLHEPLNPESSLREYTKTIASLGKVFSGMKITEDPYVISLIKENTDRSRRKLEKTLLNHKTWCRDQMKSMHATTLKICSELGAWAADYYVSEVVAKVMKSAEKIDTYLGIWDVTSAEKQYLARTLREVEVTRSLGQHPASMPLVTDKVRKLVEILVQRSNSAEFSGIIFVQERALAAVLAYLLSVHPETKDLFRLGTIVGTSTHSYRAHNIGDLVDLDSQKNSLSLFKSGQINLVIATSVLEEGIDVPSCNIVVCFHKPANLKSFVQRRGRARHKESELILLLDSENDKATEWHELELAMRKIYEDEMRTLQDILLQEDAEENYHRFFRVDSTGALLDIDNAVAHLYHFCATLPTTQYVDLRPDFICYEDAGGLIRAKVALPLSVNEKIRIAESKTSWKSEKNAIKDASFEAYVALYKSGLVNDNLLPLRQDEAADELTSSTVEKRASIVKVREQLNPWIKIARAWETPDDSNFEVHKTTITVGELEIQTYLPTAIPDISPFKLYWDAETEFLVRFGEGSAITSAGTMQKVWNDTWALLQAGFGARFPIQQKRVVMPFSTVEVSVMRQMGCHLFSDDAQPSHEAGPHGIIDSSRRGLIRDRLDGKAYIYRDYLPNRPLIGDVKNPYEDYNVDGPHLSLKRLPRRFNFFHKILSAGSPLLTKAYSVVLPVQRCTEDNISFKFAQFSMLIPSIMHRLSVHLVAKELSATILKGLNISDSSLIVTAICASVANEETNYQRLEFLGDSILKLCTSVQLMGEYPLWHEGYLSAKKDRFVSNSRLSRAAIEAGLDAFIITSVFKGHKWRPLYNEDMLELPTDGTREMSTKVLADVVEALIGAAMVDGGFPKALQCLQIFLPELKWQPLARRQEFLFQRTPDDKLPDTLHPLETLIGYKFRKKALLIEAMTHASYKSGSQSLERFEFLGDAVLDYIIVAAMHGQKVEFSHIQMHHMRTSLVNADILAFVCMEWGIEQEITDLEEDSSDLDDKGMPKFKPKVNKVLLPLWRFLRHMSPKLGAVQAAIAARHAELRAPILDALERGTHYPWALLARLQAQKFVSDMIESLLGALWIDSGSFEACTEVVERMGILKYFRRILRDNVHILHPKEELGILADSESVRYVIGSKIREVDESREYSCTVFVGDVEVVKIDDGVDKEEVKTRAAEMAVKILKEERALPRDVYQSIQQGTSPDAKMKDG